MGAYCVGVCFLKWLEDTAHVTFSFLLGVRAKLEGVRKEERKRDEECLLYVRETHQVLRC
jgi:hypothetical protein